MIKSCIDLLDHKTRSDLMDAFNNMQYYSTTVKLDGQSYVLSVHDPSEQPSIERAGYFTCRSV